MDGLHTPPTDSPKPTPLLFPQPQPLQTMLSSDLSQYSWYCKYLEDFQWKHSVQKNSPPAVIVVVDGEVLCQDNLISITGIDGIGAGRLVDVVQGSRVLPVGDQAYMHVHKILVDAMVMECGRYASTASSLNFFNQSNIPGHPKRQDGSFRRKDQTESVATGGGVVVVADKFVLLGNRRMLYPVKGNALSTLVNDYRHYFRPEFHKHNYPPAPTHVLASPTPAQIAAAVPAAAAPISWVQFNINSEQYQAQRRIAGMVRGWLREREREEGEAFGELGDLELGVEGNGGEEEEEEKLENKGDMVDRLEKISISQERRLSAVESALPPPPLSVVVDGVMWEHNHRSIYHQDIVEMNDDFKGKYVIISNSFRYHITETHVPELNSIYLRFGAQRRNHRRFGLTAAQSEFISEQYGITTTASTTCYSYVQPHDTNLAPCIVGDKLTLALCKPVIRRVASVGDVIIAWGSGSKGNQTGKVKYVIRVDEKVEFVNYMDLAWNRPDQIYTRV